MRQNFNPGVASRMIDHVVKRENVTHITGENVSKVYPWISGFKQTISGVALTETRLVRPGVGSSAFVNNTDRRIKINEIRFCASVPVGGTVDLTNLFFIENRLLCKIMHQDFAIIPEWLPLGLLYTSNDSKTWIHTGQKLGFTMTLPTPYYLQAGHSFRVRVRSTNPYNDAANYNFSMALFGKDPKNDKPYNLIKNITMPYRAAPVISDTNPQYVDVVFDDNRDYPMRDMLLTHIGFEAYPYRLDFNQFQYFNQLDFQIVPPEGPKWMDFVDWVPTNNLVDQSSANVITGFVRYALESPIIFDPTQQITIDVKPLFGMSYLGAGQRSVSEVPLWVAMLGTQEQKVQG